MKNEGKVLVCITIQRNSKRLIEKGAALARAHQSQLHILHIEKGMSIFQNPDSATLLEDLFKYGKELGGEVHFISDQQIAHRIVSFIREMGVTNVVLGETMRGKLFKLLKKDISSYISSEAKDLEVLIIEPVNKLQESLGHTSSDIAYSEK
ncbi:MAG: universal stress protein [Vallitaleaceae bacterium]|nr:universal stress protein [Vallitaleaceae bacterium]